jgi:hypothetical protein
MSISNANLIIGYSFPEYSPDFVKRTFDAIFGEGFVEYVIERVITTTGRPTFKKFYLFIQDQDHPALKQIKDIIAKKKFAKIGYTNVWDRKTRKYVDRYWKVYDTPNRPEFKPYLIEPWSAEADAAFRWQQIGKDCQCPTCLSEAALPHTITIPTMERDNGGPYNEGPYNEGPYNEGPYKMVRAVNMAETQTEEEDPKDDTYWEEYWKLQGPPKLVRQTNQMAPSEDEYESAKDFADLEAAIEKYGQGSIAPKTPHTSTESSEDWEGLAKSLDEFMETLPGV